MNIVQDVVIVGGGQAGLALGYYLKKILTVIRHTGRES